MIHSNRVAQARQEFLGDTCSLDLNDPRIPANHTLKLTPIHIRIVKNAEVKLMLQMFGETLSMLKEQLIFLLQKHCLKLKK